MIRNHQDSSPLLVHNSLGCDPSPPTTSVATSDFNISELRDNKKRELTPLISPRPHKKRKVHFAPQVEVFAIEARQDNEAEDGEDVSKKLWWDRHELDRIRSRAKSLASEIANNTTNMNKNHHLSYRKVMESVYFGHSLSSRKESSLDECDETEQHRFRGVQVHDSEAEAALRGLFVWVQYGHSRRGLERWSVPSVGLYRQDQRDELLHCVLKLQHQMDKEGEADGASVEPERRTAVLRQLSEYFSHPAKKLARAMGVADAQATQGEVTKSSGGC